MTTAIKFKQRDSRRILVLVSVLSVLLPLLAALQYNWLGQLSNAERVQMREILQIAASRFSQDFESELASAYNNFRPEPGSKPEGESAHTGTRYARWVSSSQFPRLVRDIWLVTAGEGTSLELKRFIQGNQQFQLSSWPAELAEVRTYCARQFQDMRSLMNPQVPDRRGPRNGPPVMQMSPVFDPPAALLIPLMRAPIVREPKGFTFQPPTGFVLVTLDLDYIREEVLPELTRRHFPGESALSVQITIVRRKKPSEVIFRTGPLPALPDDAGRPASQGRADVTIDLLGARSGNFPQPPRSPLPGGADSLLKGSPAPPMEMARPGRNPGPDPGMFRMQGMNPGNGLWQMQIQHRAGSLDAAITSARRRNLAISFSILVLLGGSFVSIMLSTRRAHRLAQQQVEFVAAVTHELRTPIAVIHTAAQNLADGVIKGEEETSRYGTLISRESRRLAGMIEEVLEFAGSQSRQADLVLRKVRVIDLIDGALAMTQPLIQKGGFQIQKEIQPGLPDVMGDEPSLRRALQNLLDNAIKFSGDHRRIGLHAQELTGRKTKNEVKITIQDYGMGVPQDELPHIFDPFFRGKNVVAAQIRGNGLGLSLVKSIMEAQSGRVLVESQEGRGTRVSIFLPMATRSVEAAAQGNCPQDGSLPAGSEGR